jgi:alkanesulfonate monooxygenase SsuD/methylene tetrahydromethanopterin reductase-like flavin-dependent oxidoreductase (luciferase family)
VNFFLDCSIVADLNKLGFYDQRRILDDRSSWKECPMSKMKLGLLLPNQGVVFGAVTIQQLIEMAEEADRSRIFDTLFVGDNLLAKPRLESITLLSMLAGLTRRTRLGTACMASFPLRNPIVLAAQWAALDNLSEGRSLLVACIGGGGSHGIVGGFANEYRAFGIPTGQRVDRLIEGMQVLRTLWTEDPATHHGEFFDFEDVAVRPPPIQQPCPPIWIANNPQAFKATSAVYERAISRVGQYADGWMTTMVTPTQYRTGWQAVQAAAIANGREPDGIEGCVYHNVHIGEREAAFEESKRFLDEYYTTNFDRDFVEMWTAHGSPQECAEKLKEFEDAGVDLLSVRFSAFDQIGQMRRFVNEVVPLL